ncbi:hypothetical protein FOL47_005965 [Perkinsus chesapeaki]|uniref:Uncharacterized protein n=1 Tax=Perkinsus chesapeaki TaxID=330153 RepID=A0A7J6MY16_PERCH|nr:hypothetical protein FOL47_005965 [Perkinsus chesapeaki]
MSDIFSTLNAKLQEGAKQLRESYVAEDIQQFVEQLKKDTKDYTQQIGKKIDEMKGSSTTSSVDGDIVDVITANEKYNCLPDDIRKSIREMVNSESTYSDDLESEYQVVDAGQCQGVASEWGNDKDVKMMYAKLVTNGDVSSDDFWTRFATKLHYIIASSSTAEHKNYNKESPATEGRREKVSTSPEGRLAAEDENEDDEVVWEHAAEPHRYNNNTTPYYRQRLYNQEHPGRCRGGVCCWERRGRNPRASADNAGEDTRHLVEYSPSQSSLQDFTAGTRDFKSLRHVWSQCEPVKAAQHRGKLPRAQSDAVLLKAGPQYYSLSNTLIGNSSVDDDRDAKPGGVAGCRTRLWSVMKVPNLTSVQYDIITNGQVSQHRKWKQNPLIISYT